MEVTEKQITILKHIHETLDMISDIISSETLSELKSEFNVIQFGDDISFNGCISNGRRIIANIICKVD